MPSCSSKVKGAKWPHGPPLSLYPKSDVVKMKCSGFFATSVDCRCRTGVVGTCEAIGQDSSLCAVLQKGSSVVSNKQKFGSACMEPDQSCKASETRKIGLFSPKTTSETK